MARWSDRDVARAVLLTMAESDRPHGRFAPLGFYDLDAEAVADVEQRLPGLNTGRSLWRRLMRVCNRLESYGVISGRMVCTHKEYIGEPTQQKEFTLRADYACRLCPERNPHYKPGPFSTPESELNFLLRHAYPKKDED